MTLVVGRRGSGKSTRVKAMIGDINRVVVFDPQDEYAAENRKVTRCETVAAVLKAIKAGWQKGFMIAYIPVAGNEPAELHRLVAMLWRVQANYIAGTDARKLALVVEEMDLSFPVSSLPAELNGMARACNQGRHAGLEIIGVTQRPALVSSTFRGNISEMYIFALAFANDRASILQMIGREHDAALLSLEDHHYLRFANGSVAPGQNSLKKH